MAPSNGLPRATFAKLLPHAYHLASLQLGNPDAKPIRANGRGPNQARAPNVNASSLTHAHGSALVRTGDTTVICGVRGETIPVSRIPNYREFNRETELTDYDLLVPNIELATGSGPQFLPGVPPTTLAQTLSTRVYSLLHKSGLVDAADLRIWYTKPVEKVKGEEHNDGAKRIGQGDGEEAEASEKVVIAYWVLYIDIFFISYDGNPFDVAWAAMLAALRDTKLPLAHWDPDREMVLCTRDESKPLSISGLPIACTAVVFTGKDTDRPSDGNFLALVDPDRMEEEICDETVTAVVDKSGGETVVLALSKHGGIALSPEVLRLFVEVAERRWEEFARAIR